MNSDLILVTGGTGFVGTHCILQLLNAGYRVRTTVRSLTRESDVRAMLRRGGVDAGDRLTFIEADLLHDNGWREAVDGCRYVQHVASPLLSVKSGEEEKLIRPAVDGTLRVLRVARDAGVQRAVLTSSFAAVGYGHPQQDKPFDETTWTNLNGPGVAPYVRSKAMAERAAWDFLAREGGSLELVSVNPTAILGPVLGPDFSESIQIVERMLNGSMPACPRMAFGVVDVRDVADLLHRAMVRPEARGERFLAVAGPVVSLLEISAMLRKNLGAAAAKAPTREIPDWLVRALAPVVPLMREIASHVGKRRNSTAEKARRMLQWSPRTVEQSAVDTANSLIDLGLIKGR